MKVYAVISPQGEIQGRTIIENRDRVGGWANHSFWHCRDRFMAQESVRFWMRFFWPSKTWEFYTKMGFSIKQFELKEIK